MAEKKKNHSKTDNLQEEASEKKSARARKVANVFICLNLAVSAVFMFATLYSDCFGLGDFFANYLAYIGFFDVLVIGGFIFGLSPIIFARFVSFAIAGFSLYCGWSAGEFDSAFWTALLFTGNGMLALSHIAVASLTFRQNIVSAVLMGLCGLSVWYAPIALVLCNF